MKQPFDYVIHGEDREQLLKQILTCQLVTEALTGEQGYGPLIMLGLDMGVDSGDETVERPAYLDAPAPKDCDDPECPFCIGELGQCVDEKLRQANRRLAEFEKLWEGVDLQEIGKLIGDLTLGDPILQAVAPKLRELNERDRANRKTIMQLIIFNGAAKRLIDIARQLQGEEMCDYRALEAEFDKELASYDRLTAPRSLGIFGEETVGTIPTAAPPVVEGPAVPRRNRAQCNHCKDIIESTYRHDFKWCKCGKVAVDGGNDYHKRCGNDGDWTDLP